jgi:hypothetical protein
MQKVQGSNPTKDKNLLSFFDCEYLNGLLSCVDPANGKYCFPSHPSDERHTYYGMNILRHRPHASNVAVVLLLPNKNGGEIPEFIIGHMHGFITMFYQGVRIRSQIIQTIRPGIRAMLFSLGEGPRA